MADRPDGPMGAAPVMRFRFHRGSLADSLATMRTFRSRAEMVAAIAEELQPVNVGPYPDPNIAASLGFVLYADGPDERIGWPQTYMVTLGQHGIIGFSDTVPGYLPPAEAVPESSAPVINSRPEIGEPRPADESPPPWAWGTAPQQRNFLFDGKGRIIVNGWTYSDDVRGLIAAAPELLRLIVTCPWLNWSPSDDGPNGHEACDWNDAVNALLAGIDATLSRGGG